MVNLTVAILGFIGVNIGLMLLLAFISWLVRPIKHRPHAGEPIECGMPAEGNHRGVGFNFIQYAVLFLIFDLGSLYIFLYAIIPEPSGVMTLTMLLSIIILLLAIIHATGERRFYAA